MSLQSYYDEFRCGAWAVPESLDCPCGGRGWAISGVDTVHRCPIHFMGQLHPEDYDEDETAAEYERRNEESMRKYRAAYCAALATTKAPRLTRQEARPHATPEPEPESESRPVTEYEAPDDDLLF